MTGFKDRHLFGGAAAACAVCCAAPLVGLLGVAGFAATAVTLVFAGAVFALVVGVATLGGLVIRRRRSRQTACTTEADVTSPVSVELQASRPVDAP